MSSCSQLIAQQQGAKPTASLYDLELGMPRDQVLAGLVGHYKLNEVGRPPDDPSKGYDVWFVLSGEVYAGQVAFTDGKLSEATVRLYPKGDEVELHELMDNLFAVLFDNSGHSAIDEQPGGLLTRARSALILVESVERSQGKAKIKTLKFLMPPRGAADSRVGQRLFVLESVTGAIGKSVSKSVSLDESIIKEWRGQTGQGKK